MKHGAYSMGGSIVLEFWWAGERVSTEEFNRRLRDQMRAVLEDVSVMKQGMDLGRTIAEGEGVVAGIATIEDLLRAPLCETCRMMVEARKPS